VQTFFENLMFHSNNNHYGTDDIEYEGANINEGTSQDEGRIQHDDSFLILSPQRAKIARYEKQIKELKSEMIDSEWRNNYEHEQEILVLQNHIKTIEQQLNILRKKEQLFVQAFDSNIHLFNELDLAKKEIAKFQKELTEVNSTVETLQNLSNSFAAQQYMSQEKIMNQEEGLSKLTKQLDLSSKKIISLNNKIFELEANLQFQMDIEKQFLVSRAENEKLRSELDEQNQLNDECLIKISQLQEQLQSQMFSSGDNFRNSIENLHTLLLRKGSSLGMQTEDEPCLPAEYFERSKEKEKEEAARAKYSETTESTKSDKGDTSFGEENFKEFLEDEQILRLASTMKLLVTSGISVLSQTSNDDADDVDDDDDDHGYHTSKIFSPAIEKSSRSALSPSTEKTSWEIANKEDPFDNKPKAIQSMLGQFLEEKKVYEKRIHELEKQIRGTEIGERVLYIREKKLDDDEEEEEIPEVDEELIFFTWVKGFTQYPFRHLIPPFLTIPFRFRSGVSIYQKAL